MSWEQCGSCGGRFGRHTPQCPELTAGNTSELGSVDPSYRGFQWQHAVTGGVLVWRADLPAVADVPKFAVHLTASQLEALLIAARQEELGGTDRTGDL